MVKFGNRGGNIVERRNAGEGGRSQQQGGFKRRGNQDDGGFRRRGGNFERRGRRGGRFGGPRRGGPRREGGRGGPRNHDSLDEDLTQYWEKAGFKDKRKWTKIKGLFSKIGEEQEKSLKEKLDRELEEYNKASAAGGAAAAEQKTA